MLDATQRPRPPQAPTPKSESEDLEFEVMPHREEGAKIDKELVPPAGSVGSEGRFSLLLRSRTFWLTIGIAIVLIGGGVFAYFQFFNTPSEPKPPDITVPPPVAEEKDTDRDGLTDSKEQELGTNLKKPDSDADGLADGDEVNIFRSDPLLYDTDGDGYEDGQEIAFSYSPISNSKDRASPEEIQAWSKRIAQFGLHEPSSSTLKLKSSSGTNEKTTYENKVYKYSVELPSVLTYRETDEGRNVGIYVAGTAPVDSDVLTDPISLSFAIKVESETLKEWIDAIYKIGADYQETQDLTINAAPAVRLVNMPGEACNANRTYFARGSTVIIVAWTCNEFDAYKDLYEQIVHSFKFQ